MPITPADVLAPKGRIEPDLFPGEGDGSGGTALHARLAGYLADAYGRSGRREMVLAWAHWRAFDAVCVRLAALPSQVTQEGAGGHAYAADQRQTVCRMAADALAEYRRLEAEAPLYDPVYSGGQSRTTRNQFDW